MDDTLTPRLLEIVRLPIFAVPRIIFVSVIGTTERFVKS